MSRKLGLLMSGGLDSYIAWHYAQRECGWRAEDIMCVYIDIGNPYADKEKRAVESFREDGIDTKYLTCEILKPEFGNMPDNENIWIPGRNLTLATIMASIGADEIWVCALKGEMHQFATDKNEQFFEMATQTLTYVHSKFKNSIIVRTPFAEMSKRDIVKWALDNGISKEKLLSTSSCLSGEEGNCGNCMVCVRRWGIFHQFGFTEKYNQNPLESEVGVKYIKELVDDLGKYEHYDVARLQEVLPAFSIHEYEKFIGVGKMEILMNDIILPLGR